MKVAWILLLAAFLFLNESHANLEKHFRKIENKPLQYNQVKNIDYIYLINLDQRPEKYSNSIWQLRPYGIEPYRFSAIYGWGLTPAELNEIGLKFKPGMSGGKWARYYPLDKKGAYDFEFLREECYGNSYFSKTITPGAIGCTLSHLSILRDAYNSGFQTIWIMEDDIFVQANPHQLGDLISKLDALVTPQGWDILYTDLDIPDRPLYYADNDFESDLKGGLPWFAKPDAPSTDVAAFARRSVLSDDFIKIGSRMRTHSMIIRRSGMKKILDYMNEHHIYIPYDHDLSYVPDIQTYSLRYPVVTFTFGVQDTANKNF